MGLGFHLETFPADLQLGASQQPNGVIPRQPAESAPPAKWAAKGPNGLAAAADHEAPQQRQGNGWARPPGTGGAAPAATDTRSPAAAPPQAPPASPGQQQRQPAAQQAQVQQAWQASAQASPAEQQAQQAEDDSVAAEAELEAILTRIAQLDAEGWFQAPVSEADAPRYYTIIKQPMCFQVMRTKIRARQYCNWQEVVRDFELICTNAMKYNQKRSRIHKLALVMLRAGKKLLIEVETQGRKAIERLHPAGSTVAAAAAAAAATPLLGERLLLTPSVGGLTPRADAALLGGAAGGFHPSVPVDAAAGVGGERDPMLWDGPPGPDGALGDVAAGYSSYDEETDLEEAAEEAAGNPWLPGAQPLQYAVSAVLRQPWSAADATELPGSSGADLAACAPVSREWRAARRGVEWRVRWLELRLRELHHQQARYLQQLAVASAQEQQQQQAGSSQQQAAQEAGGADVAPPRAREALPELQLPRLLEHPFFAAHSSLGGPPLSKRPRLGQQGEQPASIDTEEDAVMGGEASRGAAQPLASAPVGAVALEPLPAADDPNFGARAHAALELLERRLAALRRQLVPLQAPALALGGGHTGGLTPGAGLGGRAAGGRLGVGTRSGAARRGGGLSSRRSEGPRSEDSRLLKRRRAQEQEVAELLPGILVLPKFVERVNRAIDTPRVRVLSGSELKKRAAAVQALAASLKEGGTPDPDALAAIDALCPGESSGEEDGDTDEAFAERHAAKEAEERAKYEAFAAAATTQRNNKAKASKLAAKEPRSKQQQQAARVVHRTASAPAKLAAAAGSGGAAQGAPTPPAPAPAAAAATTASAGPPSAATSPSTGTAAAAPRQQLPPPLQQPERQEAPGQAADAVNEAEQAPSEPAQAEAAQAPGAAAPAEATQQLLLPVLPLSPEAAAQMTVASALASAQAAAAAAATGDGEAAAAQQALLAQLLQGPLLPAGAASLQQVQHAGLADLPAALQAIIPPVLAQQPAQPAPAVAKRGRGRPPGRPPERRRK
eukprot:scaffold18.g2059.t1